MAEKKKEKKLEGMKRMKLKGRKAKIDSSHLPVLPGEIFIEYLYNYKSRQRVNNVKLIPFCYSKCSQTSLIQTLMSIY